MLDLLRRDGIADCPGLQRWQAQQLANHLVGRPCYPEHVKIHGDGVARHHGAEDLGPIFTHDMAEVLAAPWFFELALATAPLAAEYLGMPAPPLYSVNAYWARAGSHPIQDLQTWHRDYDDTRFVALFVYGTDMLSEDAGPHLFKMGTHHQVEEGTVRPEDGEVRAVFGLAGTAFVADTRGLHMGQQPSPVGGTRLLLWARWCVSPEPWIYGIDHTVPATRECLGGRYPADPAVQEQIKLVVR